MSHLLLASMALGVIIIPCALAFVCMPQDDGRRI